MILLDTNAVIRLELKDRRTKVLQRFAGEWVVSPATVLELQYLWEVGRLKLAKSVTIADWVDSAPWEIDEPPVLAWFEEARAQSWTHDVFDRLIAAHAITRGLKLATSDATIAAQLGKSRVVAV
ncbi:MAG: PIN domain-containing protein [Myxococcaceae bacterium]|nr:PIN domain-containing protein [Myxococcaceae bacterium]